MFTSVTNLSAQEPGVTPSSVCCCVSLASVKPPPRQVTLTVRMLLPGLSRASAQLHESVTPQAAGGGAAGAGVGGADASVGVLEVGGSDSNDASVGDIVAGGGGGEVLGATDGIGVGGGGLMITMSLPNPASSSVAQFPPMQAPALFSPSLAGHPAVSWRQSPMAASGTATVGLEHVKQVALAGLYVTVKVQSPPKTAGALARSIARQGTASILCVGIIWVVRSSQQPGNAKCQASRNGRSAAYAGVAGRAAVHDIGGGMSRPKKTNKQN